MKGSIQAKGRKGQKGRKSGYDLSFRRMVAKQYIDGDQSFAEVAMEHDIKRSYVQVWVKKFSCELRAEPIIVAMTEQEEKEVAALKKQIESLKKKLEFEQMRNFALETMADLAKSELGIDIRKNSGAKQPEE